MDTNIPNRRKKKSECCSVQFMYKGADGCTHKYNDADIEKGIDFFVHQIRCDLVHQHERNDVILRQIAAISKQLVKWCRKNSAFIKECIQSAESQVIVHPQGWRIDNMMRDVFLNIYPVDECDHEELESRLMRLREQRGYMWVIRHINVHG